MPTRIEWCDETINPLGHGCYGPGGTKENPKICPYCYAYRLAKRGMRGCELCKKFIPHTHFEQLERLKQWKTPKKIFVQSMGDLFHSETPDEWIKAVFAACEAAPQHKYLFLTKNPRRYEQIYHYFPEQARCLYGATITCQRDIDNIPNDIKPFLDFVSIEPLLGEINVNDIIYWKRMHYSYIPGECVMQPDHETIDKSLSWVIVGEQTGPGAVPPKPEWVQSIIDQCRAAGVPIFIKKPLWDKFQIQEYPEGLR